MDISEINFLIEYFTVYLQTAKQYRVRMPMATPLLNLALVSFVYGNNVVTSDVIGRSVFVVASLVVMIAGVAGLFAVRKSYDRFMNALTDLHEKLGSEYASAYEAKEISTYS